MRDALCFLTTLPLRRPAGQPAPSCVRWFPMAGLVIGVAWVLCDALASRLLSPLVAGAVVLIVDAGITGALHLDAMADVADGVASRRPPPEAVAIMREPGVGAVGAAVLVLTCLLRLSLVTLVSGHAGALVTAPVAGRAAMALLLATAEAEAGGGSLAAAFQPASQRATVEATILAAMLAGLPALWGHSPLPGLCGLAAALAGTVGYARWWKGRFGPLTGDGVGACGMIAETLALLVLGVHLHDL